jgi:hypothetical protein
LKLTKPDGRYQGTIAHAYVAEDGFDAGEYVLKLDVNLQPDGAVTCRQPLKESEASKRDAVLKELGLTFPIKASELGGLKGHELDVNLKTSKKGNQNAYVATMKEERILTAEEIDALVQRDSDIPF